MPLDSTQLHNANRTFRTIDLAGRSGTATDRSVLEALTAVTPNERAAALDFVDQGSDSFNGASVDSLFERSPLREKYRTVIGAESAAAAIAARGPHNIVQTDVDDTLLVRSRAIPGMKAVLDVLGEGGGGVHVISARTKTLADLTAGSLQEAGIEPNSMAFGTFKNWMTAGAAHAFDWLSRATGARTLVAEREKHYASVGAGKLDIARERLAAHPERTHDFLGDDVEGDPYFFAGLLRDDDARTARGESPQVGLLMLHVVSGKELPARLVDEPRVVRYTDAADLAEQLRARGRIDRDQRQEILDGVAGA